MRLRKVKKKKKKSPFFFLFVCLFFFFNKTKGSTAGDTTNKVAFYNGTTDGTTDEVAI